MSIGREATTTTEEGQVSRPLLLAAMVLAVIVAFLGLDRFAGAGEQLLLGGATWLVLIASCRPLSPEGRTRVALVVLVATGAEILGSIVLGAYTYRLENLPAFVPPGHGLVYLAGLRISQSALVREHRRAFLTSIVALIAAWGAIGLVLLARVDVLGAVAGAMLILVIARGRAPTLYAGVFLVVAFLELYGTAVGAWSWAEVSPVLGLPAGNPPSGIASVYVLFDIAAITLAPRVLTTLERLPALGRLANAPS
jgi:hypothetical protein